MWKHLKVEDATKSRLQAERGEHEGEEKYADYLHARKCLVENILEEIKAIEPSFTDHGPRHVINVLENIERLLGDKVSAISGTELYCLILATLFHDAGNVLGRENHQRNISKIYDFVRKDARRYQREKIVILQIVAAHCGLAADGSSDTLKSLGTTQLDGKPVNSRHIAAVLRFADELAEGPQRTSGFRQQEGYSIDSRIYHDYASMVEVCIDLAGGRIALDYNLNVSLQDGELAEVETLKQMIQYIFKRILKLDQERKYTKHYCPFLAPFQEVSAVLNFWLNGTLLDIGLKPLNLSDLVVPGDAQKQINDYDQSYVVDSLIAKLRSELLSKPASTATP
jgi:hypothetical protein